MGEVLAALNCFLLTCVYVGSLYIWGKAAFQQSRDMPTQIKRRSISVSVASVASILYVRYIYFSAHANIFWRLIGFHTHALLPALFWPPLLTAILFAGPLLQSFFDGFDMLEYQPGLQTFRNLVVGPITEEIVFRACMCPVLLAGGFSPTTTILIVPLFFGIAHLHHIMQHLNTGANLTNAIFTVVFQLGYTTIFGIYSAYIFVRTGHILPAIIAHAFCNYMGFPHFGDIPVHPKRNILAAAYVLGLLAFFYFLPSFHDPHYYGSVLYSYSSFVPQ
eukprot:Phypoly_transcript_11177.p1 GENE.Phypoly_transcript_11177~~Phypoly_transcript_11177.p1  ORF type:complete len:276 (+),score=32.03 Phypoly_transcript_11177:273-1100(+)